NVEAVAEVAQRGYLLCTLFVLAAMRCVEKWREHRRARWIAATLLFWAAALASHEQALAFPLLLLALEGGPWLSLVALLPGPAALRRRAGLHVPPARQAVTGLSGRARSSGRRPRRRRGPPRLRRRRPSPRAAARRGRRLVRGGAGALPRPARRPGARRSSAVP